MTSQTQTSIEEPKVVILGGGPAGLAVADACAAAGRRFILLERSSRLGGLAQTLTWGDRGAHDLGPHKIFTLDKQLLERVRSLIPENDWLTREKKSRIYLSGHYLPYPPSPFGLIRIFGLVYFGLMVFDYGLARIYSIIKRQHPKTFQEDLIGRVGRKLYHALFKPIAEKLWGDGAHLDAKLSKGRVQTPKLSEVLARLVGIKKTSDFEVLEFIYPRGGLQRLWDEIQTRASRVGDFMLGHEICGLRVDSGYVRQIDLCDVNTQEARQISINPHDMVFSTIPLGLLPKIIQPELDPDVLRDIKERITLNDLTLVFLHVDKPSLMDDSWIFVPDPNIIFHRVSEQESFDPGMTPNGSIVCCEIMNNELRDTNSLSDVELHQQVLSGLHKMGVSDFSVLDFKIVRLPRSYPVFKPGFEDALAGILDKLDSIKNFRTIGRQGAFNYIGTLDAMDIGYGAARWYLASCAQEREESDTWIDERGRTKHFPVLD